MVFGPCQDDSTGEFLFNLTRREIEAVANFKRPLAFICPRTSRFAHEVMCSIAVIDRVGVDSQHTRERD